MSRTPQNADISGESMDALSPTKYEDTFESYPAESNIGNGEGSQDNEGKRKRNPSKYCQSPYDLLITHKKRVKKVSQVLLYNSFMRYVNFLLFLTTVAALF